MKSVITPCTECGIKIELAADQAKLKVTCPHCGMAWDWINPYYSYLINIKESQQNRTEISNQLAAPKGILTKKILEVRTGEELKQALKSRPDEILILDEDLATRLRAIKYIKSLGPLAIAAVIAAIPLAVSTGGSSAVVLGFAAPTAIASTTSIVALCAAIGGTIVISIFTDWEEVEIAGVLKLKRKTK